MPIWNGCQPVLWCHVLSVPRNGAGLWGAVRWGGLITVSCTCAHIRHATLLYFLLHFHTRTHTHTSCYKCATVHSLALPHSCLATLLYVDLHFHTQTHTHVMLQVRYCTFSRTSTLMSCYATVLSLALPHAHTHTSCYKCATVHSLALPHSCLATLLYFLLHFHTRTHTHVMLQVRYCTFSRASTLMSFYTTVLSLAVPHAHTHTSCYMCATVHFLALLHSCHATLLYMLLHFHTHSHVMLQVRYCAFSRT